MRDTWWFGRRAAEDTPRGVHHNAGIRRALARVLVVLLAAAPVTVAIGISPASAAAPTISVTTSGAGTVIAGDTTSFSIRASNGGASDGFNLAFAVDLPAGVTFVSSPLGAPAIYDETSTDIAPAIAADMQRWVWEDVSDLPAGASVQRSFTVSLDQPVFNDSGTVETADATVFPVGSTVTIDGYAYLGGDPALLPVFQGSTGVGGATAISETGSAGPESHSTDVVSLDVRKSEPSPESELVRGVHDNTTVYRLDVENTTEGSTSNVVVVDWIPAGLEFLGCGTVDNSTVDRDAGDATVNEYLGAPALTVVPVVTPCVGPVSVDTLVATAGDASTYGVTAGEVYTRVEWNLGTLAPGATETIRYRAGVPLYENTTTWDGVGGEPSEASTTQGSNLDNNNGPSTRHGSLATAEDGDTWTNAVTATGDYLGVVRELTSRSTSDRDTESIDAMDLHVLKSVAAADEDFEVGNVADFTLELNASEYMESSDIVLVDVVANGLCPLVPAGTPTAEESPGLIDTDCSTVGVVTGAEVVLVEAFDDGTFEMTLRPTSGTYPDPDDFVLEANGTHEITYQVLNRDAYELAPSEYGPTTSGDGFGNSVSFTADTDAITELATTFPDTWRVWDDSGESIGTDFTTISKLVMPRDEVEAGLGAGVNPCTVGSFGSSTESGFRMGDTVCFELRVDFPSTIDVRNPVVTDFLPDGFTYAGHEVTAGTTSGLDIDEDATASAAGRIEWELGTVGEGGDRYVSRGSVFIAHVWATVDEPSNGPVLDKPANLLKYRQQNVTGDIYFLRTQADAEIDPALQLAKGVQSVENNAAVSSSTRTAATQELADGNDFLSDRDGIEVAEGEVVTYRIDLHTQPYTAAGVTVWDALPEEFEAADVSNISDAGVAYDPGDAGYPAGLDTDYAGRSVIVWEGVAVPYSAPDLEARHSLTYDVTVPTPTSVATDHENTASIIEYTSAINTDASEDAQQYYPEDSLAEGLSGSWNVPGEGTMDDSSVFLPTVEVDKTVTSITGSNNSTTQLAAGEIGEFEYSVTIPAYTSVFNGVLSDSLPTPANWTIVSADTTVTYPTGTTAGGATGFTHAGGTFTIDPATGELTFPTTYTNLTASDETFTVHLEAYIEPTASWSHSPGTNRTNTARFSADNTGDVPANAHVQFVEPSIDIAKLASSDEIVAGQTITYTLTISNAAGRPTSFDTVVTDCVPAALTIDGGSFVESLGSASVTGPCTGGSLITWNVGSLDGGATETLEYDVTVSVAAAGEDSYTNEADIVGYSVDDEAADRKSYSDDADETVTVVGGGIAKAVAPGSTGIGDPVDYSVEVTLPADVNFYDAAIIDVLEPQMDYVTGSWTLTCEYSGGGACVGGDDVTATLLAASGNNIGWWLDDITAAASPRIITIDYQAAPANVGTNVHGVTRDNDAYFRWTYSDSGSTPADAAYDPGVGELTDDATVTVVEPSPTLAKSVSDPDVEVGETVVFELTATNASGRPTLYDTVVVDCVPDQLVVNGASFTASQGSASITGSCTGGSEITWNVGSIAGGGSATLSYEATVGTDAAAGASYTNEADLTGYSADDPGADRREYTDDATETVTLPETSITKTVSPTSIGIGDPTTYTVEVPLPANLNFYDAAIIDVLSSLMVFDASSVVVECEYTSGASTGTDCLPGIDVAGDQMTATGSTVIGWWFDDIPSDADDRLITITYDATPALDPSNVHGVTRDNDAYFRWSYTDDTSTEPATAAYDPGDGEHTDDATITVVEPVPTLTKSVDDDTITANQVLTYTVTASNASGRPNLYDTQIVDCIPADLVGSVAAISPSQGSASIVADPSCTGTRIVWDAGTIAGGASATLTYELTVASTVASGDSFTNEADLTGYSADDPGVDRRAYTDDADETVSVITTSITKDVVPSSRGIGDPAVYTIDIDLPANLNFYDAALLDTLAGEMTFDASSVTVTCEFTTGANTGDDCLSTIEANGTLLTASGSTQGFWFSDIVANSEDRLLTVTYEATPSLVAGNVHNVTRDNDAFFRWSYTDTGDTVPTDASYDPGDGEHTDDATLTVVEPVPTLTKVVNDDTVAGAQVLTYTLTASNLTGRPALYDTVVIDCVPGDLVDGTASGFVAEQGSASVVPDGSCTGVRIVWDIGTINGGEEFDLTYQVTVATTVAAGDSFTNEADLSGFSADDPSADRREYTDDANETVTVIDPAINKTVTPTSRGIGDPADYTVTVDLDANVSYYDAAIVDVLPTRMTADLTTVTIACEYTSGADAGDPCAPDITAGVADMTQVGNDIGWWFDDIAADAEARRITITYQADADLDALNVHGVTRLNRAYFRWSHTDDTSATPTTGYTAEETINDPATLTIVEPVPTLTKSVDDDTVEANQTLTYTLTASNASGRPTLYDTVVLDCVPDELAIDTGSYVASQGSATTVGTGCPAGFTALQWTVGSIAGGGSETLTYEVEVSPLAAAGATYTNEADLTGYSADDPSADRREYTDNATESVTVIGGALTKTVDAATQRIGEEAVYTVEFVVPANVNFFDTILIDDSAATVTVDTTSLTYDCTYSGGGACSVGDTPPATSVVTPSGTTVGWWLGDITSANQSRTLTLTYTATVLDTGANVDGATRDNDATLRWAYTSTIAGPPADVTYDPAAGEYTDDAQITLVEPDLGITKEVNGAASDTVDPGETFSYEVVVTNSGTSSAYDVVIEDVIPNGVRVTEATITGGGVLTGESATEGGGTITWTITELQTGGGNAVTLAYDATTADSDTIDTTPLTNDVTVTEYFSHPDTAGFDTDERREYGGETADATVTPQFPALDVVKTPTGTTAYIDTSHEFTITVENTGDSAAESVEVVDTLPAGWVYDAGSTEINAVGAADPGVSGSDLTWATLPDLAPGDTVTITYTATPDDGYAWNTTNTGAAYDHTNDAVGTADDTSGAPANQSGAYTDSDDADVQIHRADLAIDKAHSGDPVAGENFSWTIDVENLAGSDTMVGPIVITDTLPADANFVSATGTGWSASESGGVVTITHAGPLAADASLPTVTVTVAIDADVASGTNFDNDVTVAGTTFEFVTANNDDTDPATVTTSADLGIVKDITDTTYVAGTEMEWTLDVTNYGPSVAQTPIVVTDTLPVAIDVSTLATSGTGWVCAAPSGGEVECTWTGTALAVNGSLPTLTMTADVLPSWTTTIENTADVDGPTPDPNPDNDSDSDTVGSVDTEADLSLVKSTVTAAGDIEAPGTIRYRVEVDNAGPSDALNVIVTDQLPTGLTFAGSVTSGGDATWSCVASGSITGQVDCTVTSDLGTLEPGDSTWFEFDATIATSVYGDVTNEATVSSDTDDTDPSNDTDDSTDTVISETNLTIEKTHDDSIVYLVGDEVTFTITVTNEGPADARNVEVVDALPDGMTYVGVANDTGWTASGPDGSGNLTLALDDPLAAGGTPTTASIDIVVELTDDAYPLETNPVSVTTTTDEPDTSDNSTTEDVEVDSPDLRIYKTTASTLVQGGDTFTYTIEVGNVDDDAPADPVVVTDDIPADLAVTTAPAAIGGTDWDCTLTGTDGDGFGGTLECTLATALAPATGAPDFTFDVEVATDVARDTIPNTAVVSSTSEHPDEVDALNSSTETIDIRWIDFSASSVCLSDAPYLDYSIQAVNTDAGLPVTLTWYADNDADGVPDGAAIATQTLDFASSAAVETGSVLWPGAEVDEAGVAIAWPGWRVALAGETPTWENQLLDPTLPEYPLRDGALVVVEINPEAQVQATYPPSTVDCEEVRDPVLVVNKDVDRSRYLRSEEIEYTISVTNETYGATNDVVLSDPLDEDYRLVSVTPVASTDPEIADWAAPCTLTGEDLDGYGGTVECVLDGWLGYGQTTPEIELVVAVRPDADLTAIDNTAWVRWVDPDGDPFTTFEDDDMARIRLVLALTGSSPWEMAAWALALIGFGTMAGAFAWRLRQQ